MQITKELFIENVVLPFYEGLNSTESNYIIYDLDGKIITAHPETVRLMGVNDLKCLQGKSFKEIYKFNEQYPDLSNELNTIRTNVMIKKIPCDHLCVAEFLNGIKAYMMENKPLLYLDGSVVGTIIIFNEIERITPSDKVGIFTLRQEEIIFLLSVGGSQKEAASILETTRGTIGKTMEMVGTRINNFAGCSKRLTIDKAAQIGCGKLPMGRIKPGIVALSKLYNNTSILSLFNHF